jgi:hypothetical protein
MRAWGGVRTAPTGLQRWRHALPVRLGAARAAARNAAQQRRAAARARAHAAPVPDGPSRVCSARSGAGFLLPFYLGVIDVLQKQMGILKPDMPVAGSSAGSIAML